MTKIFNFLLDRRFAIAIRGLDDGEEMYQTITRYRIALVMIHSITFAMLLSELANGTSDYTEGLKFGTFYLLLCTILLQTSIMLNAEKEYRKKRVLYTLPQTIFYVHASIYYWVMLRSGYSFDNAWLVFLFWHLASSISFKEYVALKRLFARTQ